MIALFTPSSDGLQLDRLYDAKEHRFAPNEFMDIVYQKRFKKPFQKQKK